MSVKEVCKLDKPNPTSHGNPVCLDLSWTDRIQSAVDDLKKSGATIKLMLPTMAGGVPLSPTMYGKNKKEHTKQNPFLPAQNNDFQNPISFASMSPSGQMPL